jgi:hypothetical protein
MENGAENQHENPELDSLIGKLTVMRDIVETPVKTYGNVSPEYNISWSANPDTIMTATQASSSILSFVRQNPRELSEVIKKLIESGSYFESIKNIQPGSDMSTPTSDEVDGEMSSRMVTETIMGIGETALPFLRESKERYAKDMVGKINREIMNKKIKRVFENLLPRKK